MMWDRQEDEYYCPHCGEELHGRDLPRDNETMAVAQQWFNELAELRRAFDESKILYEDQIMQYKAWVKKLQAELEEIKAEKSAFEVTRRAIEL